ncbi:MAG: TusE/DsrC/DsvC family sulfur relay protein [Desulfobacteraceae bacterium]|jgi:tRNA 2-thiouridine synthesizing protein E|nr:TusE/DsrC/DsvC family sulfur relay protein [Desulfobacteraceae bacterium]
MGTSPPEQGKASGYCLREIAGRNVVFDDEGFFEHFEEWSQEIFEALARECGIEQITDRHRQVVRFLREFYAYNARAPLNSEFRKGTAMSLLDLEGLFPDGLKRGARRLAGLPNPKTCS